MSTELEKKWDVLWRAACAVSAAYENKQRAFKAGDEVLEEITARRLVDECAALSRTVNEICPDFQSSTKETP